MYNGHTGSFGQGYGMQTGNTGTNLRLDISFGVLLMILGFFQYLASKNQTSDIQFTSNNNQTTDVKGVQTTAKISVDVEGKVLHPGVYSLPEGSRIQDALIAAGGMSSSADRVYISKHLNQAQKIVDGGKIYIPATGEIQTTNIPAQSEPVNFISDASSSEGISGLININSATEGQLDSLPKVGPVTAKKIIAGRPYGNIEELVSKKVLGQKTFDGLKDKIVAE
jgi:competence protein ComEA